MAHIKKALPYYFTVEGETEQWYLQWLQDQINNCEASRFNVNITSQVCKNPQDFVKQKTFVSKTVITHVMDVESQDECHVKIFKDSLQKMRDAQNSTSNVKFNLGYSNFTFELWIILHKMDCSGSIIHRDKYLKPINSAFREQFRELDEYKSEAKFKKVLSNIVFPAGVIEAINRAKKIEETHIENGYAPTKYKTYEYFEVNPSTSLWKSIEKILNDCKLY